MQGFEEHELTEKQHTLLRRAFARYASLNFARGVIQEPRHKAVTALQDTVLARELGTVSAESTTALRKVGKDECGLVLIRNLPLGLTPPSKLRDESVEQWEHRHEWPGKYLETNEDIPKFNLAPIALAALGGAVGKETDEQDHLPRTINKGGIVKADPRHTDKQPYTILLCTRGNYASGKQLGAKEFKENEYKPITKFYLLKDILKDDRISKAQIATLLEPRFHNTRESRDTPKIGPILLEQKDGSYRINAEIFSMTGYVAAHDKEDVTAAAALATLKEVITTSKPSHSLELKRGDAVAFTTALVAAHERTPYRTHEDPTESRELMYKLCTPTDIRKFPEAQVQRLMETYYKPSSPSH